MQVREGFIVDEDEEIEERARDRRERRKRRREEREREDEHLDEDDLELIGELNPDLHPPVAAEVCQSSTLNFTANCSMQSKLTPTCRAAV